MLKQKGSSPMTRRQFIYYSGLAAGGLAALSSYGQSKPRTVSANEKLNIGCIGCGGKGSSDTQFCSSENIVALCDVSENAAAKTREKYPDAKFYKDYREMLEKEKSLDAVDIATPDHMHAVIAATAIKMGKHVYCQQPLTHDGYEARVLRQLAKEHGAATEMGTQRRSRDRLRRAVEIG